MIPWYYMWSEKYRFFHEIFQDTMKEREFSVRPIYLDQSVFDSTLHQGGAHAWTNSTLKVDKLIEALESSELPYVLFTDIDLVCKDAIFPKLQGHIDARHSMVFLQEGGMLNIGFMLLMVCKEVIDFWKEIRTMVLQGGHDQAHVNEAIKTYALPWGKFDPRAFTCSNTWDGTNFSILQTLSSTISKEDDLAEKIYNVSLFVNIEPYMKYIPLAILPYVDRIQRLLRG
jgi:hypothetical protein